MRKYLKSGEEIIWEGRPMAKSLILSPNMTGLVVVFALLLFAGTIADVYSVSMTEFFGSEETANLVPRLIRWAALFGMGIIMFLAYSRSDRASYVMTNKRVFIFYSHKTDEPQIFEASKIKNLQVRYGKNKLGTITFNYTGMEKKSSLKYSINMIPKPKEVLALLKEIKAGAA